MSTSVNLSQTRREKNCLYTANEKIFLNISNFACGTRINNSLILNILVGPAVEYCGDVMFYYFLLADNSGCYNTYTLNIYHLIWLGFMAYQPL